jgi:hypothetical protein
MRRMIGVGADSTMPGPRRDWLSNLDQNEYAITNILRDIYGDDAVLWRRRWRPFFLATAGPVRLCRRHGVGRQSFPVATVGAVGLQWQMSPKTFGSTGI